MDEPMDEPMGMPTFPEFPNEFNQALQQASPAPAPQPGFVAGLERQLLDRQAALLGASKPLRLRRFPKWSFGLPRQRAWQLAALMLLAALVVTLLAVGPQHVLAQVQRWLGYVPGIGFVDLDQTRVLAGPVEITREGVVLRVEQVVAGPERTQIVFSSPGLSEEDLPWPNDALDRLQFVAYLRLPDGSRLEPVRWELSLGAAKLEFPSLPAGVYQITLEVARLPLVPPGALPENWEAPLSLRPASGELVDELFPQPYSPAGASDTHHGVTLRVLDVAQGPAETAVQWQVEWPDPQWELRFGLSSHNMPELRDDLGHVYWEKAGNRSSVAVAMVPAPAESPPAPVPAPQLPNKTGTLVFPSLSLTANRVMLQVDGLEFQAPASAGFMVDLGPDPQIGDSWPLDIRLDIAGFPVHFTGARLRQETNRMHDGQSETQALLEFDLDPLPEKDCLRLSGFDLSSPDKGFNGGGSTGGLYGRYKPHLNLSQVDAIPSGRIQVQVTGASLVVLGPWEVAWDVPRTAPVKVGPAVLLPQATGQERNGVRLEVQEAFLSDRLAAIKPGAPDLPPGAVFIQPVPYDPETFDPSRRKVSLVLEDNWGRRYDLGRNEVFLDRARTEQGHDPGWLFFPPLEPLAQSVTLHVPGVELLLPGQASFTIDVPDEIVFKPEEYTVNVIGGGGPEREETRTQWVSDPWAVDIPVEIAGYRLRFTQARLEHEEGSGQPYQLLLTGEALVDRQGEQILERPAFASVSLPDGETVGPEDFPYLWQWEGYLNGWVGRENLESAKTSAVIRLDVTTAGGDTFLPGRYQVVLNGMVVWVPGPWELSWPLSYP